MVKRLNSVLTTGVASHLIEGLLCFIQVWYCHQNSWISSFPNIEAILPLFVAFWQIHTIMDKGAILVLPMLQPWLMYCLQYHHVSYCYFFYKIIFLFFTEETIWHLNLGVLCLECFLSVLLLELSSTINYWTAVCCFVASDLWQLQNYNSITVTYKLKIFNLNFVYND